MGMSYGLTTRARNQLEGFEDGWTAASADGVIDAAEIAVLSPQLDASVAEITTCDDMMVLSLSALHVGPTKRVKRMLADCERLHGPIELVTWADDGGPCLPAQTETP